MLYFVSFFISSISYSFTLLRFRDQGRGTIVVPDLPHTSWFSRLQAIANITFVIRASPYVRLGSIGLHLPLHDLWVFIIDSTLRSPGPSTPIPIQVHPSWQSAFHHTRSN